MASFLKKTWEDSSTEEISRARGAFIAFTTGLEDGMMKEQFRSIMDPMLTLQDVVQELKELQDM